jgi:hypothetical protein
MKKKKYESPLSKVVALDMQNILQVLSNEPGWNVEPAPPMMEFDDDFDDFDEESEDSI